MVSVVIAEALLARRAEDPSIVPLVAEWSKTAMEQGDSTTGEALTDALAAR